MFSDAVQGRNSARPTYRRRCLCNPVFQRQIRGVDSPLTTLDDPVKLIRYDKYLLAVLNRSLKKTETAHIGP
jgi:hypothetical protein